MLHRPPPTVVDASFPLSLPSLFSLSPFAVQRSEHVKAHFLFATATLARSLPSKPLPPSSLLPPLTERAPLGQRA